MRLKTICDSRSAPCVFSANQKRIARLTPFEVDYIFFTRHEKMDSDGQWKIITGKSALSVPNALLSTWLHCLTFKLEPRGRKKKMVEEVGKLRFMMSVMKLDLPVKIQDKMFFVKVTNLKGECVRGEWGGACWRNHCNSDKCFNQIFPCKFFLDCVDPQIQRCTTSTLKDFLCVPPWSAATPREVQPPEPQDHDTNEDLQAHTGNTATQTWQRRWYNNVLAYCIVM